MIDVVLKGSVTNARILIGRVHTSLQIAIQLRPIQEQPIRVRKLNGILLVLT